MRPGDNGYIRELNYKNILDTIRTRGAISRIELSRVTGLTRSTCSVICDRMLKQGIIMETGKQDSTGGRPAIELQINTKAGAVLGMKMMDDQIAAAAVDLGGGIIHRNIRKLSRGLDPEAYLGEFEAFVSELIDFHGRDYTFIPILGIGIGLSGRISSSNGVLLESSVLGWNNVPICERLSRTLNIPVFIENDVNTFAIGEKFFGAGKPYDNLLCLSVGQGIGMGIIIDGNLYSGSHHGAGEIGHTRITFDPEAPSCSCGKKGCLESYASDRGVLETYRSITGERISIEELILRAERRQEAALEAFSRMGEYLGTALSSLVNLFDPQAIIIGGERTNAAVWFRESLERNLKEGSVYNLAAEVKLVIMQPSNDDWIRGAAALAIREFFSNHTI